MSEYQGSRPTRDAALFVCERCGRGPGVLAGERRSASVPMIVPVKSGATTLFLCVGCERERERKTKRFAKARRSGIRLVPSS